MKNFAFLFLFILSSLSGRAQFERTELSTFINETCDSFDLPSLSLAIIKGDEIIFDHFYGKTSTEEEGKPVNIHTVYGIASLSKAFTAAAVAMLVDEGKLDWDDKVIQHLPWFKMYDEYVTQHMTISDLLSHRSGLITFDGDLLWYGSEYDRKEIVRRIQFREPTYEFRANYGYQNIMFITAGEVIEAVSGMSWDKFVKTRILLPLDMIHTTSSYAEFEQSANRAEPHIDGKMIEKLSYDNSGATAALNSCVDDMAKWAQFWLNNGIINGDTLISENAIKKIWTMHTPQSTSGFDARNGVHFKGYGHGWFMMDYNGKKVLHHGGGLPGYITKVALVPEEDFAIVALTNDMSNVPEMMMYMLIDWTMGKETYKDWPAFFLSYKKRSEKYQKEADDKRLSTRSVKSNVFKNSAYVGRYTDIMFGDVMIRENGKELELIMEPSKDLFTGKLSPWGEQSFKWDHKDPFLTYGIMKFETSGTDITGFTIDLPNYDFHFDKLHFQRTTN